MRNFKIVIISFFSLLSQFVSAQEFKVEAESVVNKTKASDIYKIVFPSAYGFTTYHYAKPKLADITRNITVTNYNQSIETLDSFNFELPNLDRRIGDLMEVVELEDRLLFLSKTNSKKSTKHEVNAQVYSKEDKKLITTKILSSFVFESYSKSGFYSVAVSPDKAFFAIYATMPFEKKANEKVQIWVYDNELNLIWETKKELEFESKRAYSEKVFVTNQGNVILNKTLNPLKKTRVVYNIQFNKEDMVKTQFSSDDFFPNDYVLKDINGESFLLGFFWNLKDGVLRFDDKQNTIDNGVFAYNINQNKIFAKHEWSSSEFSYQDSSDLIVSECLINENDLIIIGEKYYKKSEFNTVQGKTTMDIVNNFTHANAVIINLELNGTLKNISNHNSEKVIYLNEQGLEGGLSTFKLGESLYVFDNENVTYDYINGLRIKSFFDNNEIRVKSYFSNKELPIDIKKIPSTVIDDVYVKPHLLPKTMSKVKDYNIIYFMTTYNGEYKINKMLW